VLTAVIRSDLGLAFRAIGQNLQAARASGINPTRFLVINFTLSCAFAGWLGGFYAHYYGILTPDIILTSHTVEVLAVAYIGGRGSLWGPAIIAFPLTIGVEVLPQFSNLPGLPRCTAGSDRGHDLLAARRRRRNRRRRDRLGPARGGREAEAAPRLTVRRRTAGAEQRQHGRRAAVEDHNERVPVRGAG
jgi:hypothetical protein